MFHKTLRLVLYFFLAPRIHVYQCVYAYTVFSLLFSFYDRGVDRQYFTIRNEAARPLY